MLLVPGGRLLGDHQMELEDTDWGYLQTATHRVLARKSYVHVEAALSAGRLCTLVCVRAQMKPSTN